MTRKIRFIGALLAYTAAMQGAWAGPTRIIDAAQINNSGATISLPSTTTTLCGATESCSLTNKTISGASNTISNLPASAISSGTIPVGNGGTGQSSLTANGIVVGNGLSGVNTVTGTQNQTMVYGVGGVPAAGALPLNQSAAVSGQLPVGNGGTGTNTLTAGSIVVGNGTSAVSLVAPGSNGNVLTSNGSAWVSSAAASVAPSVVGSTGTPTAVTAVGGVSFSGAAWNNIAFITGSGGAVTITANPQIAAATNVGQQLIIYGNSDTNTVTLSDGTGLNLNGPITLRNHSIIGLIWNGSVWAEHFRR
jgi:hypothetical protein